ncbi:MAG TPA: GMC family oxidoreductase [Polyangiaceae bacterium]
MKRDSFDVVVVGSGAGGGPIALELARAGARVLVIEKGPHVETRDFVHDEVAMRRHFMVPDPADEPHTLRYGDKSEGTTTSEGWTANIVGGGTVHYSGFFHRMHPVDMRMRSTLGPIDGADLVDWPISYDDLEPYYRRVDEELGVSGTWRAHPFEEPRSGPYPLPPLDEHPIARRIDEATAKLGMHAFPTPRAVASRPYRGRRACAYCSMCADYGCPTGAKGSTLATVLPAALATGHCELRAGCMVTEVTVRPDGRASAVVYRDPQGISRAVEARVVVLACSAIETARLLLVSRSAAFPDGLANGSGLVGKNLVFSSASLGGASWSSDRDARDDGRHLSAQRTVQDFYWMDPPVEGVAKGGTLSFLVGFVQPIAMAEGIARRHAKDGGGVLWGTALKKLLRDRMVRSELQFETFCEFYATPGTYVDLDPAIKDRWGTPVARMTVSTHPRSRDGTRLLARKAVEVLKALGAEETYVTAEHTETKFLQGGTCRFGKDPATSVLDETCRAHEVPNLYVTDGSFLPTSGGVPLTLTIMANSFRVADHLARRLREGRA